MKFFRSSRRPAWHVTAVCGAGWLLCGALPAEAQPPEPIDPVAIFNTLPPEAPQRRREEAQRRQEQFAKLAALSKEIGSSATDPAAAAARYRKFLDETPHLLPDVDLVATNLLAPLLYQAKDTAGALALLDAALAKYTDQRNFVRLVASKAKILTAEKRPAEAVALFKTHWPKFKEAGALEGATALRAWADALEAQIAAAPDEAGAQTLRSEMIGSLREMLLGAPAFLFNGNMDSSGWMYDELVENLIAAKQTDEALSWAKLRFMECAYNANVLRNTSKLLAKAWIAKDPSRKEFLAFVAAQRSGQNGTDNPLAAVPLPKTESSVLAAQWADVKHKMAWQDWSQAERERVSLLILGGRLRQAVREANTLLRATPQSVQEAYLAAQEKGIAVPTVPPVAAASSDGIVEMLRALKANDLNLVRANAFLAYVKTPEGVSGTGANPVADLIQAEAPK